LKTLSFIGVQNYQKFADFDRKGPDLLVATAVPRINFGVADRGIPSFANHQKHSKPSQTLNSRVVVALLQEHFAQTYWVESMAAAVPQKMIKWIIHLSFTLQNYSKVATKVELIGEITLIPFK
jgi:hypothetical protein